VSHCLVGADRLHRVELRMTAGLGDQYKTDENLRRRQSLFEFAVPAPEPQPELTSVFTWAPRATVLDVGCGNGLWARAALGITPEATVVGVDSSPGMANIVREQVGTPAVAGDITCLPVRTASADAVLALWMLYHVPDKAAALAEVSRVLRPGGFLVAATNSADDGVLGEVFRAAAGRVLNRSVTAWGPTLDFTVENGGDILSTRFSSVERWVVETWFDVNCADPFVAVAESMRDAILMTNPDLDFEAFVTAVTDVASEALDDGHLRFVRRSGFFRASGRA
jgi:ubiquinone/menaquinone biosynthesis C-methylase UbiE